MELIQKWLNGNRSYIVGTVLYKQYGANDELKMLFSSGSSISLKQRLVEELEKLVKTPETAPLKAETPVLPTTPAETGSDPVLAAFKEKMAKVLKYLDYKTVELQRYTEHNEQEVAIRHRIAIEILTSEKELMAIENEIAYYKEHGRLPDSHQPSVKIPDDPIKLGRFIENTKRNLRRNKQLASENPDDPTYPALVKQYEHLMKIIEQKLKQSGNEQ